MDSYLNTVSLGMEKNRKLHLRYKEHPKLPQMVCATYDDKVIGDYLFLPVPFELEGIPYYYMVNFYPTGETFFLADFISCIDAIEMSWQYYKATQANS